MADAPPRLIPEAPEGYTRVLRRVNYKTIIRSQCDYCGLLLASETAEDIWAEEMEHREFCHAPRPAAASGE